MTRKTTFAQGRRLMTAGLVALACALASLPCAACAPTGGDAVTSPAPSDTVAAGDTLPDGSYLVDVSLEGGTGRASVTSPARVRVADGQTFVTIEWSSPNYDYVLVGDRRYLPTNSEGNSTFEIEVPSLAEPLAIVADTTAMSKPHEIDYTLTFDLASAVSAT